MEAIVDGTALKHVLRTGWFFPDSPIARVVTPDLVMQARAEAWPSELFIQRAIPLLKHWLMVTLRIPDAHLGEATLQNVWLRMAQRRPDLHHKPEMAPMASFFRGIAQKIHYETVREEHLGRCEALGADQIDRGQQQPSDELEQLEQEKKQQFVVACLHRRLSRRQWESLGKKYGVDTPEAAGQISNNARYIRRFRTIRAMQRIAASHGLRQDIGNPVGRRTRRRRITRCDDKCRPASVSECLREQTEYGRLERANEETMRNDQATIDADNARALQALFDSLPAPMKDRTEVLAEVRDVFEREFAKRSRWSSGKNEADADNSSAQ